VADDFLEQPGLGAVEGLDGLNEAPPWSAMAGIVAPDQPLRAKASLAAVAIVSDCARQPPPGNVIFAPWRLTP
jgi:hypothetical protein